MPKEKSINPAQAQRKAEKAKAVKKGKAEAASRRNEKLARRNPERLQKQLDDLKAITSGGGKLTSHEQRVLEELEKDVKSVRKAREALGDKAPVLGARREGGGDRDGGRDGGRGGGVLGKRRRDGAWGGQEDSESDVPEEVSAIPMPRDTPPPIPKEVLDKWYQARRDRYNQGQTQVERREREVAQGSSANRIPLGDNARIAARPDGLPPRPGTVERERAPAAAPVEVRTVYEAAPVIRDLRKEAVSAFMPAAVRMKLEKSKGKGGLVEPEEADALERAGYLGGGPGTKQSPEEAKRDPRAVTMEEVEEE